MTVPYHGPERRNLPHSIYVEPTSAWWGKVVMPFLLPVLVQFGIVIWWAAETNAKVDSLQVDFEQNASFNGTRHTLLLQEIKELREEMRDDRKMLIQHYREHRAAP